MRKLFGNLLLPFLILWCGCTSDPSRPAIIQLSAEDEAFRDSIRAKYYDVCYTNTDSARLLLTQLSGMYDRYDPLISKVKYYDDLVFLYARIDGNTDSSRTYLDSLRKAVGPHNVAANLKANADFSTAVYYQGRELYDSAIKYNLQALDRLKTTDDSLLQANVYSSMSELYIQQNNYVKAAYYYAPVIERAMRFQMPLTDINTLLNAFARMADSGNDSLVNMGYHCIRVAKQLYDSVPVESVTPLLYNNLGVYYFKVGKPDSALYYLKRCIAYENDHPGLTNHPELSYGQIIKYYMRQKQYTAALHTFHEMQSHTDTANYNRNSKAIYHMLDYRLDSVNNDMPGMLQALQRYTVVMNEMHNDAQNDQLLKYEVQVKQLANDNYVREKQYEATNQRYYVIFITIIAILTFAASICIYFYWKKKRLMESRYWKQSQKRKEFEHRNQLWEERCRIAQEMHDDLGTTLTSTLMAVEMVEAFPEQKEHLSMVRRTADNLHQQVNEIIWNLNTQNDNIRCLNSYMIRFARNFLKQANIRLLYDEQIDDESKVIPSFQRRIIYLSFKELMNNIVKHANATEVKVNVETRGDRYHICIEDNGVGMNTSAAEMGAKRYGSTGYGLANINKNISRLFGNVYWQPAEMGRGTRVEIEMNILVA